MEIAGHPTSYELVNGEVRFFFPSHVVMETSPPSPGKLHSLKLTASLPLKMHGWNTIVSFWDGLFSGGMLVLGRVDLRVP